MKNVVDSFFSIQFNNFSMTDVFLRVQAGVAAIALGTQEKYDIKVPIGTHTKPYAHYPL